MGDFESKDQPKGQHKLDQKVEQAIEALDYIITSTDSAKNGNVILDFSVQQRIASTTGQDPNSQERDPSSIRKLLHSMDMFVQKYTACDLRSTDSKNILALNAKVDEQELRLMKLLDIEHQRELELDHMRKSVLSLQQDLMRLMNIVEMQMQIPKSVPHLGEGRTNCKEYPKLLIDVDTSRYEVSPLPHSGPMIPKNVIDNGHNVNVSNSDQMAFLPPADSTHPLISPHDTCATSSNETFSPQKKRAKLSKLSKRPWTSEEDQSLARAVQSSGASDWSAISRLLPGRCGKQCRERWVNHLSPSVNKDAWTEEEDDIIFKTREKIGNHWADIARLLPGRTDNAVKNRFYSTMRRRLRQQRHLTKLQSQQILCEAQGKEEANHM